MEGMPKRENEPGLTEEGLTKMSHMEGVRGREEFETSLENAKTLTDLIQALEAYGAGQDSVRSDFGKDMKFSVSGAIDGIIRGYGGNVSDSVVQRAYRRLEGDPMFRRDQFEERLNRASTEKDVLDTIDWYSQGEQMFPGEKSGDLSVEDTKKAIRDGFGGNVSYGAIQRAARRIGTVA